MKKTIKKILRNLLEVIFPVFCLGCGQEGAWLCPICAGKIKYKNSYQDLTENNQTFLAGLFVVCDYEDKIIQKAIHLLKYGFARDLRLFFRLVLSNSSCPDKLTGKKEALIIPLPLHPKRKRFRGFNQSEILAEEISNLLKIPIKNNFLLRKKYTRPQVGLDKNQRNKNIKDAFCLNPRLEISAQSVILIDDVYTTGSTMNEAAKALKKAGVKEVIGFVIARG